MKIQSEITVSKPTIKFVGFLLWGGVLKDQVNDYALTIVKYYFLKDSATIIITIKL